MKTFAHTARHPVRTTLVLAALSLGAGACKKSAPATPQVGPATDAAPVRVTTAPAAARNQPRTLALTGTLVPDQQSELTPLVSGRVLEVLVERGTSVREGQPLMRLRDVDYRTAANAASAQLQQARSRLGIEESGNGAGNFNAEETAEVRSARANRDLADDSLRRAQQLAQTGAMSPQELERAQAQAAAAREQFNTTLNSMRSAYFQYQSARVQVDQARRNVNDSTVRAPFEGEIAERKANVGEYVTPQRAILTLVRTNPLRIELQVPQEQVAFVRRGQTVQIRVDALPERSFIGTIQYISAAVRQDNRSLTAEAIVPNADGALRPGLFATARLQLDGQQSVVVVPTSAVLSEAGTNRVFVIVDGRAQERVVSIAERGEREVLISRGVTAGEQVATDHLADLSDGTRVQ